MPVTSVSLPVELLSRLEEENNKSRIVKEALYEYYGMDKPEA